MSWEDTTHVICIGKDIAPGRQKFTEVGVAWVREKGKVSLKFDITLILTPSDKVYLFPKKTKGENCVEPNETE
jgi:hypothetical protein